MNTLGRVAIVPITLIMLALWAAPSGAQTCKADGDSCRTNQSCCSRACVNGAPPGSKPFGVCCTATTCSAQGANCGTIPNGTCPQPLNCGSCTGANTCGGGGTPNVCGCVPTTCQAQGANCGMISNGCGGMLNCGTCTAPATCGGDGTPNVCGGRLPCTAHTDCISTRLCVDPGFCEPKLSNFRACIFELDCLSGCCCGSPGCSITLPTSITPAAGICMAPADCPRNADLHCPTAFGDDHDFTTCD